jgi:predicted amidohydrolase YtcJ
VRAIGYHESVAGSLDRTAVDGLLANRPVRIQHRSGELWVLNSAGIDALGVGRDAPAGVERDAAGVPTGRLWRLDGWLRTRIPIEEPDLGRFSRDAAAAGVTGFTDAGPDTSQADADSLAARVGDGTIMQRLCLLGPVDLDPPAGGDAGVPATKVLATKVLLDDARLPSLGELIDQVTRSHARGRPVAVHCVTRVQLVLTVAALEAALPAPGDRIEHASVVPAELVGALRGLGVTVVTQPNFVAERGDTYLAEVDAADQSGLYRIGSLRTAGVPVAAGTDAPFGGADVWAAMRAAVHRLTPSGRVLGAVERVPPDAAAAMFTGEAGMPARARRVAVGHAADLCLLRVPIREALRELDAELVAATVIGGRVISRRA